MRSWIDSRHYHTFPLWSGLPTPAGLFCSRIKAQGIVPQRNCCKDGPTCTSGDQVQFSCASPFHVFVPVFTLRYSMSGPSILLKHPKNQAPYRCRFINCEAILLHTSILKSSQFCLLSMPSIPILPRPPSMGADRTPALQASAVARVGRSKEPNLGSNRGCAHFNRLQPVVLPCRWGTDEWKKFMTN